MIYLLEFEPENARMLVSFDAVSLAAQSAVKAHGMAVASAGTACVTVTAPAAACPLSLVADNRVCNADARCRVIQQPGMDYGRFAPRLEAAFTLHWNASHGPADAQCPQVLGFGLQWQGVIESYGEASPDFLNRDVRAGEACRLGPCSQTPDGPIVLVTALSDTRIKWSFDATPITPLLWLVVTGLLGLVGRQGSGELSHYPRAGMTTQSG